MYGDSSEAMTKCKVSNMLKRYFKVQTLKQATIAALNIINIAIASSERKNSASKSHDMYTCLLN